MKTISFENNTNSEHLIGMRELTEQEMRTVVGGNLAGAGVGAAAGGAAYLGGAAYSGDFSWRDLGASVLAGAATGGTMGATAFGAYAAPRIAAVGGFVTGVVEES